MNTMPAQEQGSTFLLTLILLAVITVIAVGEVAFNSTQTRIAANTADAQIALQTAEAAMNQATTQLLAGAYPPSLFIANTNGTYLLSLTASPVWNNANWASSAGVISSYQGASSAPAVYIIEQLPSVTLPGQNMRKPTFVYRITARATGASGNTPLVLQKIVLIPQ